MYARTGEVPLVQGMGSRSSPALRPIRDGLAFDIVSDRQQKASHGLGTVERNGPGVVRVVSDLSNVSRLTPIVSRSEVA
jgi:hypothetical protein